MDNKNKKPEKPLNLYIKFTSVAFQMIVVICVFSFFGLWLDKKFPNNYSAYTMIFSLIGVIASMYMIIKQVININKDKE